MSDSPLRDRYALGERLGKGGMGEVFLADDLMLGRRVAIKFLAPGVDQKRLLREARAAGRLTHPNIVTIYDAGADGDRPFIAMEFVDGKTFDTIIRERTAMSLPARLRMLEQLCEGLHAAHQRGIVHLDIKPSNLMMAVDGRVRILDFGIATASDVSVTFTNSVAGSLPYMAPEQLSGEDTDARTDVFAATAVAYELLSYERAYPGGTQAHATRRLVDTAVPPLSKRVELLGEMGDRLIRRGLNRDRLGRFQTAEELGRHLSDLRRHLEEMSLPGTVRVDPMQEDPVPMTGGGRGLFASIPSDADADPDDTRVDESRRSRLRFMAATGVLAVIGFAAWQLSGPAPTAPIRPAAQVEARAPVVSPVPDPPGRPQGRTQTSGLKDGSGGNRPPAPTSSPVVEKNDDEPASSPSATPPPAKGDEGPSNPQPGNTAPAPPPTSGERAAEPDPQEAIRNVIAAFARAHNARSTIALRSVYPTLTGPDFAALERLFLTAIDYRLTFSDVNVQVQGGVAKVTARASRLITPSGGDPRTVNGTAAFDLKKEPSGWIITRATIP